jgi:hypothetical protein
VGVLILVGYFVLIAWAFAAATTQLAGKPLTIWQALGIIFTAKLVSRGADLLSQGMDSWSRMGIAISVYLVVLCLGLVVTARVRPLVALGLSVAFTTLLLAGIFVIFAAAALFSPPHPAS